jgi:hypothetical protein
MVKTVMDEARIKSKNLAVDAGRAGVRHSEAGVTVQYEADEGTLTKAQLREIKNTAPKANVGTVRSRLFGTEGT